MGTLARDVREVQNPGLGSFLLWRQVNAFCSARNDAAACPLPVVFLTLPLLLSAETYELLKGTNRPTGLRGYVGKFADSKNACSDLLLGVHERALQMRGLTIESVRIGIAASLITLDREAAGLLPLSRTEPRSQVSDEVRALGRNAEKVGQWFAELTLYELASLLKVRF